jgi:CRP-like cAMP-binding protein
VAELNSKELQSQEYCFVSCDISGHSFDSDLPLQIERVYNLNELVGRVLKSPAGEGAIWASGGDGGHLALPSGSAAATALELLAALRDWATKTKVPLRLAAHVGPAVVIRGADGRVQLVGEGINMCGHLLDFGSNSAVIVSQSFRSFIERAEMLTVRFAGPVQVYMKQRMPDSVYILSVPGRFTSEWGDSRRAEQELLQKTKKDLAALDIGDAPSVENMHISHSANLPNESGLKGILTWKLVYHAKRLLQANTSDRLARTTLADVALRDDLPELFRGWDPTVFTRFVQMAELVERRHGETFCREGDEGDAMFVVLTGQIGVASGPSDVEQRLDLRVGAGVVLGELAVVLRGDRTATLQAIGDTSALSFNYEQCRNFLLGATSTRTVQARFDTLFDLRVSEFVCNHCPSLVGMDRSGPLSFMPTPRLSRYIMNSLSRLELEPGTELSPMSPDVARPGLYVLGRGELRNTGLTVSTHQALPIVYADLGNEFVHMDQEFLVSRNSGATLLHIDADVFDRLDDERDVSLVEQVADAVKRSLVGHYQFDVFISYNQRDFELAEYLKSGFEDAGLRVFLDVPTTGMHFTPVLKSALLTSLAFVPIITTHVESSNRGEVRSWVQREVAFRRDAFNGEPNIFPILTEGGDIGIVPDVTHFEAAGRTDNTVIAAVTEAVRNRLAPVPFATRRLVHPLEFESQ